MDNIDHYRSVHADATSDGGTTDWNSIFELLSTEKLFAVDGRYGAIPKTLSELRPVESLLEVGYGLGETTAWMLRYANNVQGCDIWIQSPLKRPQGVPLTFSEVDADQPWPFEDGAFDVVVAMMVLEQVFDPFHFVRECARVMTDDGILFLNVPLISFYRHRLDVLFGRVPTTSSAGWFERGLWDGAHIHYFNIPMLAKLLGTAGLSIQKVFAVGRYCELKALLPSLLCAEVSVVVRRTKSGL